MSGDDLEPTAYVPPPDDAGEVPDPEQTAPTLIQPDPHATIDPEQTAPTLIQPVASDPACDPTVFTPPPGDGGVLPTVASPSGAVTPVGTKPGERIGPYLIERELARGGMGVVHLARDIRLDRRVALKVLLAGGEANDHERERFSIEARAAARLSHPNIVGIHQVGEEAGGLLYFAMDYVEGESLQQRITRQGPLDPREAAALSEKLANALYYAHTQAILHRDMKPANVLLKGDGEPLITDFGLAKDIQGDSGLTKTGQLMGTPGYMPPEQAEGDLDKVDRRADIYSLGATLYCMLTGKAPFSADSLMKTVALVLDKDPVPPRRLRPELDQDLETICLKAMEKEPEQRYESAQALARDLGCYLRHETISARPPTTVDRLRKWVRRNRGTARAVAGILTASAAVLLTMATLFVQQQIAARRRAEDALSLAEERRLQAEASEQRARESEGRAGVARALAEERLALAEERLGDAQEEKAVRLFEEARWAEAAALLADALRRGDTPRRRGHLLRSLAALPTQFELKGPGKTTHALAWSQDERRLASLGADRRLRVWDVEQGKQIAELEVENGVGEALAWSPGGRYIAVPDRTQAREQVVRLWDVTGNSVRLLLGHTQRVRHLAFAVDGRLASGGDDPSVRVWTPEGEPLAVLTDLGQRGRGKRCESLAWSARGERLAVGDGAGGIHLWEAGTRTEVLGRDHGARISALAFSPDGALLASGRQDQTLRLWDLAKSKVLASFNKLEGRGVQTLSFSAGGGALAAGMTEGTIRVWKVYVSEAQTRVLVPAHTLHADDADVVAFGPSALRLLSGGDRGAAQLWSVDTGRLVARASFRDGSGKRVDTKAVAWSPRGTRLAMSSGRASDACLRVVDTTGAPLALLPGHLGAVSWVGASADGLRLASSSSGRALLWDGSTRSPIAVIDSGRFVAAKLRWAPRGQRVATRSEGRLHLDDGDGRRLASIRHVTRSDQGFAWAADGRRLAVALNQEGGEYPVLVLDAEGSERARLTGHRGVVRSLAFQPGGALLATGAADATVRLWDLERGEARATLAGVAGKSIYALGWSPDGSRLVGASPRTLHLWDGASGVELERLEGTRQPLAWSPSGARLVTAVADEGLLLLDPDGERLAQLDRVGRVASLAWSPDGTWLAAETARGALVWDGRSGEPRMLTKRPSGPCAWSPVGPCLAVADGSDILICDGDLRTRVLLQGHSREVRALAWSLDGRTLLSGGADGTARAWDVELALRDPAALIDVARERGGRVADVLETRSTD